MSQANYYEVQKSTDNANWVTVALVADPTVEYYHENKSNSGIAQYFRVRAVILGIPQTNLPMQSAYTAASNITCTYTATNEDLGFEVHRSLDNITYALDVTSESNATSIFSTGIVSGTTYWFKVRAVRSYPPQAALPLQSAFCTAQNAVCNFGSTQLKPAEIFRITLKDGTIVRYTSHDANIVWGAETFIPLPISRSKIAYHSNMQVDNVTLNIGISGVTVGANNYTIPQLIAMGALRKASVEIYIVNWPTVTSSLFLFKGFTTGNISYNQGSMTLECNSELDKLNTLFPKIIYTELCQHEHFRTGTYACNLTKASYKVSGVVTSTNTTYTVGATAFLFAAYASGYWTHGELIWTSGQNTGLSFSVKTHTDGYVALRAATPFPIQVLDEFDVYPGCDRTGATCATKYNNYANFFGFEYIPRTETLYGG